MARRNKIINKKGNYISRISFGIAIIIVCQLLIPVIGNINISSLVFAGVVCTEGGVTYVTAGSGSAITAEIKDLNLKEIIIKDKINGKHVSSYRIITKDGSTHRFEEYINLEKLTIPARLLQKGDTLSGTIFYKSGIKELTITSSSNSDYKKINSNIKLNNLTNLERFETDDYITEIEDYALEKCSSLKEVKLGKRVKKIGNHAFASCKNLKKVDLYGTIEEIKASAFSDCKNLEYLSIWKSLNDGITENNLRKIGGCAFYGCEKFVGSSACPIFNYKLETIGKYAFYNCRALTEKLTENIFLADLGEGAFMNSGIQTAHIRGLLQTVRHETFKGCYRLGSVYIYETVKKIENDAFSNCDTNKSPRAYTTTINIHSGITEIGDNAFYNYKDVIVKVGCSVNKIGNINALKLGEGSRLECAEGSYADQFLKNKISYTKYKEMHNSGGINYQLFSKDGKYIAKVSSCDYGTQIATTQIPRYVRNFVGGPLYEVTEILLGAFANCSFNEIIIPASVNIIQPGAFINGKKPEKLTILGTEVKFDDSKKLNKVEINVKEDSNLAKDKNKGENVKTITNEEYETVYKETEKVQTDNVKVENPGETQNLNDGLRDSANVAGTVNDNTKPQITLSKEKVSYQVKQIKIYCNTTDLDSGVRYSKISTKDFPGSYYDFGKGIKYNNFYYTVYKNGTYYIHIKDAKENYNKAKIVVTEIDDNAPQITKFDIDETKGKGKSVTISWTATDTNRCRNKILENI